MHCPDFRSEERRKCCSTNNTVNTYIYIYTSTYMYRNKHSPLYSLSLAYPSTFLSLCDAKREKQPIQFFLPAALISLAVPKNNTSLYTTVSRLRISRKKFYDPTKLRKEKKNLQIDVFHAVREALVFE